MNRLDCLVEFSRISEEIGSINGQAELLGVRYAPRMAKLRAYQAELFHKLEPPTFLEVIQGGIQALSNLFSALANLVLSQTLKQRR